MFKFLDGIYPTSPRLPTSSRLRRTRRRAGGTNRIRNYFTTPDTVFAEAMTRQASPGQAPETKGTKAVSPVAKGFRLRQDFDETRWRDTLAGLQPLGLFSRDSSRNAFLR
jgi:hypothetical protein